MVLRSLIVATLALAAPATLCRAQSAPAAPARATTLTIVGLDGRSRTVSAADLAQLARHDTTVSAHEVSGRYSGVAVTDVLALVGAPLADSLRGRVVRISLGRAP
jgi:hypothetical protein